MSSSKKLAGPTILSEDRHKGLNLVIPRVGGLDFELDDVPEDWMDYYPYLAQQITIDAINAIFPAVGYLFMSKAYSEGQGHKYTFQGLGTAFQLAPSIIATSMHVVEYAKKQTADVEGDGKAKIQLYYTSERVDLGRTMFAKLVKHNSAIPVVESYEADVTPFAGSEEMYDPLLKKKYVVSTRPDFCLLRLGTPLLQKRYFVPHPKTRIERAEVYVLGVPGKLVEQPRHIDEKEFPLDVLNNHISNGYKQHISPGHILHLPAYSHKRAEGGRVIAYDCYTHKGNSGSPVVIHTSPELVLGIHQQWSAFPHANIAPPTYDTPFVVSYVRRVIPAVLSGGFNIDQCRSIQLYLDSTKTALNKADDLKALRTSFYDKYTNLIDQRLDELEEINIAAQKIAKEEKLRKKQEKYMQELQASGLTEKEYKQLLKEREVEQQQALAAKLLLQAEKKRRARAEVEKLRAEKRKRPDYDEYEFDECAIKEQEGKDFLQVVELSAELEDAIILKMQVPEDFATLD